MKLTAQRLAGVRLIEAERHYDERGFFQRTFDASVLKTPVAQSAVSQNHRRGTVRGLHWQVAPYEETKVVTCLKGGLFDVLVDLRPQSKTYLKHATFELWGQESRMLLIPPGIAHGFQTLQDDTLVGYQLSAPHAEGYARRLRFDDPRFGIRWPLPVSVISAADAQAPLWEALAA